MEGISKIDQCIEIMQDTAKKVDEVTSDYKQTKKDSEEKSETIKTLKGVIKLLCCVLVACTVVAGIFVYGYMFSSYLAGEVNNNNNGNGNAVIVNG